MKYKVPKGAKALAEICSVLLWNQFRYPQPIQGTYDVATNTKEKLKWAYKCWVKQLEVAEKGSGLESYFAGQKLHFAPPEGFAETSRVSISAGGDLMAVDALSYESTPYLFEDIKDFYFGADLTCANLESNVDVTKPIGRNQVLGQPPKMNTSEEMLDRFIDGGNGINYYATANNHCYDYGKEGLLATLDVLDKKGVYHSGTNRSPAGQDDVLIIEQNGIKIAMLAYTFDMNGNEYEEKYLINEVRFNDESCDISMVEKHIARAREKGADLIVANCHWGWEFELYPHQNVVAMAHRLFEAGIDVILGGHPHVSQPMERYEFERDGKKRQGFVVYSLGDFVSYHPVTKDSKITYVVRFNAVKGKLDSCDETYIQDLKILPVYILAEEKQENVYDCRLLQFHKVLADSLHPEPHQYGLTDEERKDVPRLDKVVLRKILLPTDTEGLLEQ